MTEQPKLTNYVSDVDQFLQQFDKTHPKLSQSQQKEVTKYQRIYQLRDAVKTDKPTNPLWDEF
jgi:hypothetical protein